MLNLSLDEHAYIFGLFMADGNLYEQTRNRGRLSLEIRERDKDILYDIADILLPYKTTITNRTRTTNFKDNSTSYTISCFYLAFRKEIKELGFPSGNKSYTACVPTVSYNERAFWRGYLDGNGSFSISKKNIPLVSLGTKSDKIKIPYLNFLQRITGEKKKVNRNKRDYFYNVISYRERAQKLVQFLNYESCDLCIKAKKDIALKILDWERD